MAGMAPDTERRCPIDKFLQAYDSFEAVFSCYGAGRQGGGRRGVVDEDEDVEGSNIDQVVARKCEEHIENISA